MFSNPKTMEGIEKSRIDAVAKAKRDAYSAEHGGTPEDTHSRAYAAALKAGESTANNSGDPLLGGCHRAAASAVAEEQRKHAKVAKEKEVK